MNTKTLIAPAKPVTTETVTWHAQFDARITANGLGSKPTADMYRAALTLGPIGKGKRPGVEALFVAMTLRPEGATIDQFTRAGECRTANNWLTYLQAPPVKRAVYGLVTVNVINGARVTRLTAKGAAMLKVAGMGANAVNGMAKPITPAKAPAKPKGAPKAGKATAQAIKPATAPAATPAPAPAKPVTVLTEAGPVNLPATAKA